MIQPAASKDFNRNNANIKNLVTSIFGKIKTMGIKLRQFVFLSKNIFLPTKTLNGTLGVWEQNL